MTILNTNGNVGFGTSNPLYKLSVSGGHIQVTGTPTPGIIFDPSTLATKTGAVFQSEDRLIFGSAGVANIAYIELNAPDGSFAIDADGKTNINSVMYLAPRASAPSSPIKDDVYFNSTSNKLMVYDGTIWQACW